MSENTFPHADYCRADNDVFQGECDCYVAAIAEKDRIHSEYVQKQSANARAFGEMESRAIRAEQQIAEKDRDIQFWKSKMDDYESGMTSLNSMIDQLEAQLAAKDRELQQLKDWLVANAEQWQNTSGSPVDMVLLCLHLAKADNERLRQANGKAIEKAIAAIYFADSADYLGALWGVVKAISQDAADLLDDDCSAAYDKYCEGKAADALGEQK